MIGDNFSIEKFEEAVVRNDASQLSIKLEEEIQKELHDVVSKKMTEIVDQLNAHGHNLAYYYPPKPGDIAYRDEKNSELTLFQ